MLLLPDLTQDEMVAWVTARGLPAYRGRQLYAAVFRRLATSFDELTDLPRDLRVLFTKGNDALQRENFDYAVEMFYQALLGEYGKAAALTGAQRAFLARARTSIRPYRIHPYFWAAFHLIGDPGFLV